MGSRRNVRRLLLGAVATGALAVPGIALAQDTENQNADNDASSAQNVTAPSPGPQPIIVTARLREENLQDVPAAISVFTAADVANAHITSLSDLGTQVPNVSLERLPTAGGSIKASIRGIAHGDNRLTFEPIIGIVLDDVFMGSTAGINIDPFDVSSIQVLRGPQGTLFGRNTIAGAIIITRNDPSGEFGGSVDLRYGSYDRFEQRVVLDMPAIGDLSSRFYFLNAEMDSFAVSAFDAPRDFPVGAPRRQGERVKLFDHIFAGGVLLYEPSTDFEARVNFDYSHLRDNPLTVNLTPNDGWLFCDTFTQANFAGTPFENNGCRASSYDIAVQEDFRNDYNVFPHYAETERYAASLRMSWRPGDGDTEIKSITGWMDISQVDGGSLTGDLGVPLGPNGALVPTSDYTQATDYRQFTQEIRFETSPADNLSLVGGFFYFNSQFDTGPGTLLNGEAGNQATLGNTARVQFFDQDLNSYAIFGDASWDIADNFHLSIGARYTIDQKRFSMSVPVGSADPMGPFTASARDTWSKLTGRAALTYDFAPDASAYLAWSRGFRSGGFNSRALSRIQVQIPFRPETVDSFEFGLRTELFDRRIRFNPTVFYMTYRDRQETIFVPTSNGIFTNVIDNAGEQEFYGAEVELVFDITDNFSISAAAGYNHSEVVSLLTTDPATGQIVDVSGQREVVFAPEWTFSATADYVLPLSDVSELNFNASYHYRSFMYSDPLIPPDGTVKGGRSPLGLNWIPAVHSADFSLTYRHEFSNDYAVAITGFVKDAFDSNRARLDHSQNIANLFAYGQLAPTRQWGLELRFDF
ncbi:MAG: TonB-dependent receptor [Parasphingopyxis sp.]|uniref:TonB-dependent receptor n=1 Tax=Parasphingopyxis sp. TaxID=1920299 RepID=UPI0032EAF5CA